RITAGEGVIPEGAELAVSEITETATDAKSQTAYASAVTALEETAAKFVLYDISITAENAEVQPNGSITLRIPIPAEFDKSKTALYRINDDKTATLIRGNVSGDTYIVTLSHLSLYALAEGLTAVASPADAFTDISGHWAYDYIRYMIERGLIVGVTSTTFEPNTVMTRAMFVTLLGRIAGVDTAANAGTAFDDVGADEYYAPYTVWASKNGIVSGVGDNKFAPDMQITREQMAAMLNNYVEFAKITLASGSGPAFADAGEISSWASAAVRKMADAGIIAGVGDNKFAPKLTASRAEVATLLARFLQGLVV
ncbi:MAG: S-layer homology domain-containing protein, partial [Oscillospiraceae bacterium]|nr:S-layer homology domain-containing protein [Oscillospiraceae bacterium]